MWWNILQFKTNYLIRNRVQIISHPHISTIVENIPLIDSCSAWASGVGKISQDVPLNRLINYIFYQFICVLLLIWNTTNPFLNFLPNRQNYDWNHIAGQLNIWKNPALLNNIMYISDRFWRVPDLTWQNRVSEYLLLLHGNRT